MEAYDFIIENNLVTSSYDVSSKEVSTLLRQQNEIKDWDEFLKESQLIGPPGAHSRESILSNIEKFVQAQDNGKGGRYGLYLPTMEYEEVLKRAIEICGNNSDMNYKEGEDFVSLEAFKKATYKAVKVADKVAKGGGRIFLASAHAESLLAVYVLLAKLLVEKGADLYNPAVRTLPHPEENLYLSSFCSVTVVGRDDQFIHTHNDYDLDKIIKEEGANLDLAIADHGLALATIRAGIPTIAIVDTNDIDLLMAASIMPDRVFPIPIHDNAGLKRSRALIYYLDHLLKSL